jgi:hypothetical protein
MGGLVLALATTHTVAFALGHDLGSCAPELDAQGTLPALLQGCIHHYAINDTEVFWFAADAAAFDAQVEGFAALAPLVVVLQSGALEVRSPWDHVPRDLDADWQASLDFDCGRRGNHCRLVAVRLTVEIDGNVEQDAWGSPLSPPGERVGVRGAPR